MPLPQRNLKQASQNLSPVNTDDSLILQDDAVTFVEKSSTFRKIVADQAAGERALCMVHSFSVKLALNKKGDRPGIRKATKRQEPPDKEQADCAAPMPMEDWNRHSRGHLPVFPRTE